ncbi:MAG: ComF family protein [Cyanobacteria bacterium P01_F01_bin.3]
MSWGCYEGSLKRAIAQMKYHNRPAIALRLGEELGLRWLQLFPIQKSFQVVPVPLHQVRLAERGYNQAEQIARGFCRVVGVSCRPHGLVRRYQTQAQHTLSPQSRAVNLRGAFSIGPKLNRSEKPVLLLDDIFTTGATVAEAQQALNRAGFSVLGSAVVAQARLF